MGLTVQERQIELDYDRAAAHANKYIMPFVLQVEARASMIESAARKFQAFSEFPASNTALAFLDFAWTIISTVVPAVSLVSLVRKARIAEELTTASSAVRVILVQNTKPGRITKGTEIGSKVKEVGGAIYEKGDTLVTGTEPGMDRLAKLDTTKAPIKELFADARRMVAAWNKTIDFLVEEKSARLSNPDKPNKQTMFSFATERLPAPEMFSGADLDQLEAEYLWNMIARYCRENADFSMAKNGYAIHKGLNDTQQNTIFGLFGPSVQRGRYFSRPFFFNVLQYLQAFGANPRVNGVGTNTTWRSGPGHMKP